MLINSLAELMLLQNPTLPRCKVQIPMVEKCIFILLSSNYLLVKAVSMIILSSLPQFFIVELCLHDIIHLLAHLFYHNIISSLYHSGCVCVWGGEVCLFREDLPSSSHLTGVHAVDQESGVAMMCHNAWKEYVAVIFATQPVA